MQAETRSLPPLSRAVCHGGGGSFLGSLLWHALVVLALLHLGQLVTREPPQLLVNEVQLVQDAAPEPPSPVPPLPPEAPVVPPQVTPVAKPAAVPARRAVAPPPQVSVAVPTSPVAEAAPQTVAATTAGDGVAETVTAQTAIPSAAPGYHLGAVETPAPDYPFAARKRRRQGLVLVQLDVGADGRVDRVVLLESSGDSTLDEAAMTTLGRWRLRPATENNRPVPGRVEVPVRFRLE
ncbi:putative TonB, C-terminal [Magnetospirillum gryphiswaldense MSR-1 v2]|uniref:Protein TonB n=1 Tax=Magnetospirillum gryphiswaldense (strain DSM 6361 / JCM 21280 / NBRC 15271 / MSR-1) TaxID=431944 RepID=V6EWL4_MAGGM|nr:energy transducer TonB [Magnetospirillum gryphiswaldense]CDK97477.1 putative TonB, C-terminal [Magnetospirillum gryphiswaldense MSR-1 v2]